MNIKEVSSNSFSFIGDAVYTLAVRKHFVLNKYQASKSLQKMCNQFNSAKGQTEVFNRLAQNNFFSEEELEVFKRGRNHISHIPKNGDKYTYETASGLEAIVGYLYLTNEKRLNQLLDEVFKEDLK